MLDLLFLLSKSMFFLPHHLHNQYTIAINIASLTISMRQGNIMFLTDMWLPKPATLKKRLASKRTLQGFISQCEMQYNKLCPKFPCIYTAKLFGISWNHNPKGHCKFSLSICPPFYIVPSSPLLNPLWLTNTVNTCARYVSREYTEANQRRNSICNLGLIESGKLPVAVNFGRFWINRKGVNGWGGYSGLLGYHL